jgi:hypothetical protein
MAWRLDMTQKKSVREWATGWSTPENPESELDGMIAVWPDGMRQSIPHYSVMDFNERERSRLANGGALWSGTGVDGQNLTIVYRTDRKPILVLKDQQRKYKTTTPPKCTTPWHPCSSSFAMTRTIPAMAWSRCASHRVSIGLQHMQVLCSHHVQPHKNAFAKVALSWRFLVG